MSISYWGNLAERVGGGGGGGRGGGGVGSINGSNK